MDKLRLMTIVGTRPEIIRLSEVIKKCDRYFQNILVHTGQNYDYNLSGVFFEDLDLRAPDYYLETASDNLGTALGNIVEKSYNILSRERPDALLVLGDTNSALSAIAAKRLKIPIFHMEAGNRCFDENLPEEINRRIVDHIADVNLCYSENARRYLLAEGAGKDRTFVTGSPMPEVLTAHLDKIKNSSAMDELGVQAQKYMLLSAHREENIDHPDTFLDLMNAVNALAQKYSVPIIYSVHPRSAKYIREREFDFHPLVRQLPPFCFSDFNCLQRNALCVVSDSGTIPEEASFLQFPAVSIRTSTERPEALEKGGFILGGTKRTQILQSVELAIEMNRDQLYGAPVGDYQDINISTKVVRLIQSYVEVINKKVWQK